MKCYDEIELKEVVKVLKVGEFVVFFIEIVYGLGVNVLLLNIVKKVFFVKGRF